MELRARFGTVERGEESGNEGRETLLCAVGMGGRDNSALCAHPGTAEKEVILWFERSCARTCRHTFASRWIGSGSRGVGQFASEGQLMCGKVGADGHVCSATRAAPGG